MAKPSTVETDLINCAQNVDDMASSLVGMRLAYKMGDRNLVIKHLEEYRAARTFLLANSNRLLVSIPRWISAEEFDDLMAEVQKEE